MNQELLYNRSRAVAILALSDPAIVDWVVQGKVFPIPPQLYVYMSRDQVQSALCLQHLTLEEVAQVNRLRSVVVKREETPLEVVGRVAENLSAQAHPIEVDFTVESNEAMDLSCRLPEAEKEPIRIESKGIPEGEVVLAERGLVDILRTIAPHTPVEVLEFNARCFVALKKNESETVSQFWAAMGAKFEEMYQFRNGPACGYVPSVLPYAARPVGQCTLPPGLQQVSPAVLKTALQLNHVQEVLPPVQQPQVQQPQRVQEHSLIIRVPKNSRVCAAPAPFFPPSSSVQRPAAGSPEVTPDTIHLQVPAEKTMVDAGAMAHSLCVLIHRRWGYFPNPIQCVVFFQSKNVGSLQFYQRYSMMAYGVSFTPYGGEESEYLEKLWKGAIPEADSGLGTWDVPSTFQVLRTSGLTFAQLKRAFGLRASFADVDTTQVHWREQGEKKYVSNRGVKHLVSEGKEVYYADGG